MADPIQETLPVPASRRRSEDNSRVSSVSYYDCPRITHRSATRRFQGGLQLLDETDQTTTVNWLRAAVTKALAN